MCVEVVYTLFGAPTVLKVTIKRPNPAIPINARLLISFRDSLGTLVMSPLTSAKEPFASSHANQHGQYKDQDFGMTGAERH